MLSIARRILKNTLFLSFTTVADRLAEVLLFLIMARAMGPGFIGDYKTVVMFLTIFQNLANYGLIQLVMREVATLSDRDRISALLATPKASTSTMTRPRTAREVLTSARPASASATAPAPQ